jgi:hypothetical protein
MSVGAGPVRVGGHINTRDAGKAAGGFAGLVVGVAAVLVGATIFAAPVVFLGTAYTIDYLWRRIRGKGRHRPGYLEGLGAALSSGVDLGVRLVLLAALGVALFVIGWVSVTVGGFPGVVTGVVLLIVLIRWIANNRS